MIDASGINSILIQQDIEGYIEFGAPTDEYESEAAQISLAIKSLPAAEITEESIRAIIALVWAKNFELGIDDIELRLPEIVHVAQLIHALK